MPSVAPDAPDTTAPSVPTNVTATVQGTTSIALSLVGVHRSDRRGAGAQWLLAGYKVYRDPPSIATLGLVTTYSDTGLTPDTEYAYRVSARDVAGNESAGTAVTATTNAEGAAPDTTAPSVPSGHGGQCGLEFADQTRAGTRRPTRQWRASSRAGWRATSSTAAARCIRRSGS